MNISDNLSGIDFKFLPGIKVIPNRQVLLAIKTIVDEWDKLLKDDVNKVWMSKVEMAPRFQGGIKMYLQKDSGNYFIKSTGIYVNIGFYDDSNY